MSDSQEKSDDLIAELAKLMASNAKGSESEAKPTVIKLAPLSEATVPSPAPIRIPGMDLPTAPAAAAPAVRIPGMEKPAGVDMPVPERRPQPTTQFDFGKPPAASPVIAPEPLSNWQSREVPKPAPASAAARLEPTISVAPDPAPSLAPAEARPAPSGGGDSFNFDFGFNSDGAATGEKPQSDARPKAEEPSKPAITPDHDPIADLIAAELDAAQAEPAKPDAPKVEPMPAAAVFQAPVEATPARNFGNLAAGQAPVLIARPAGSPASRATPTAPASFRPLPQAPKAAESDKFAVAPVFGLGGKPSPGLTPSVTTPAPIPARPAVPAAAPQAAAPSPAVASAPTHDSDPMDEIENLIGEAVRIEISGSDKPGSSRQPQMLAPATPFVPPLTTGFAPRRAGLKDNEPQMKSAEAAILAAAAATGAEVGRIDAETGGERPYKRVKMKPQKANVFGGVRQYVGMAVAGTLLLAAGFGLYWVLGMGRGDGTAPILTADATPAKQVPAIVAANSAEPARSVVFDEIDGVAAVDSAETLVSRDETAGASVTDVARVVTPESSDSTESGLANRKVRTVTVRPDGTIVNGDEAIAGTEALPVGRPNVPTVPGAATEPSDLLSAAAATDATNAAATATQTAALDPIAAAIAGAETVDPAPLEVAALAPTNTTPAVFDASIVAPTPMPRPADRSALNASTTPTDVETASAIKPNAPAKLPLVDLTEPAAQPAAAGGNAAAYVQLSSQRSEGDARSSLRNAQSRWSGLFAGNALEIQRADLGQKGVYYRVRLPTSSLRDATQICASIKANGGDCFATGG